MASDRKQFPWWLVFYAIAAFGIFVFFNFRNGGNPVNVNANPPDVKESIVIDNPVADVVLENQHHEMHAQEAADMDAMVNSEVGQVVEGVSMSEDASLLQDEIPEQHMAQDQPDVQPEEQQMAQDQQQDVQPEAEQPAPQEEAPATPPRYVKNLMLPVQFAPKPNAAYINMFNALFGKHFVVDYDITQLVLQPEEDPNLPVLYKHFPCEPPACLILSHVPRIAYFPNFFTDAEADTLIAEAEHKLERSQVAIFTDHKDKQGPVSDVRTSRQTWLDPATSELTAKLRKRLSDMTGLTEGEIMQILHYGIGQKYDAHHDYFDPALYGPQKNNRAITNFLYLNTVEEGGETWFPRANGGPQPPNYHSCDRGLRVMPVKGSVVVFYDMTERGALDPHSLHGACPVKKGEKWGGTQWLRVPTP